MLYILDLVGTAVFAVSGGFKAVKHELDILGLLVLSCMTGVGGGIIRDLILGDTPPLAFRDEYYLIICLIMGILVFFLAPRIAKIWRLVKIMDAVGLGTFTYIGAVKGYHAGLGPVGVIFAGVMTSCGGGIIRDIMVTETPAVIKRDFYATAAAAGSLLLYLGMKTPLGGLWVFPFLVIALTTGLRITAICTKMSLPRVKQIPGFNGSGEE